MTNKDVMNVAMEWVETMKTSTDAERLRPELEAWLRHEPRHRIAYKRAERQWAGLQKAVILLQQNGPLSPEALLSEIDDVARRSRRRREVRRQSSIALVALSVCVLAGFAIRLMIAQPAPVPWVYFEGGYGTPKPYTLNDGSELFLNDKSSARVRMTPAVREVALDRGELLVRVTHDSKRSFLVWAGDVVLRAVGTEFSVQREATGDLQATVREGKVEIRSTAASAPKAAAPKSSERSAIVSAGQTATISGGKVRVENPDPTEIENRLAWVHGRLYLDGTLSQAVAQFNEHNADRIVIADASIGTIGNINVIGLYDCHDIHEFAESLRSRGVRYRVEKAAGSGNETIFLSAGK